MSIFVGNDKMDVATIIVHKTGRDEFVYYHCDWMAYQALFLNINDLIYLGKTYVQTHDPGSKPMFNL